MRARYAQALGNRFILVDYQQGEDRLNLDHWLKKAVRDNQPLDQLIELYPDFSVRFYNRDGSEAESCGNGLRCAALWYCEKGFDQIVLKTKGGEVQTTITSADDISLKLPPPQITRYPDLIRVGNPHAVVWRDDWDTLDLALDGARWEYAIPERQNVSFPFLAGPNLIHLRVWERGAGATAACGTAACATHISARLQNFVAEQSTIIQRGGTLHVTWANPGDPVLLKGPARLGSFMVGDDGIEPPTLSV